MVKRSIDFTKDRERKINELAEILGISGIYGEIPKTLDFAVIFTLEGLKRAAIVTPDLATYEKTLYFEAVRKLQERAKARQNPGNLANLSQNVTPGKP